MYKPKLYAQSNFQVDDPSGLAQSTNCPLNPESLLKNLQGEQRLSLLCQGKPFHNPYLCCSELG